MFKLRFARYSDDSLVLNTFYFVSIIETKESPQMKQFFYIKTIWFFLNSFHKQRNYLLKKNANHTKKIPSFSIKKKMGATYFRIKTTDSFQIRWISAINTTFLIGKRRNRACWKLSVCFCFYFLHYFFKVMIPSFLLIKTSEFTDYAVFISIRGQNWPAW